MSDYIRYQLLRCPECAWREVCSPRRITERLRQSGKIRPTRTPELELLYELFRVAAADWDCPRCKAHGLRVESCPDETSGWPGAVLCETCGKPIDPNRMEAMPQATRCAACETGHEQGKRAESKQYCPRCGSPLEVKVVQRGGKTRYILSCSATPPCPM